MACPSKNDFGPVHMVLDRYKIEFQFVNGSKTKIKEQFFLQSLQFQIPEKRFEQVLYLFGVMGRFEVFLWSP